MSIRLELIEPELKQIEQLFVLLEQRAYKISHESLPTFDTHKTFVENHPYRAWYLIMKDEQVEGTIYVQNDNSVGINNEDNLTTHDLASVLELLREQISPLEAIPSLRYKDFYYNVAIANESLQKKLNKLGLLPTQISYVHPNLP